MLKVFSKNDNSFTCINCGAFVPELGVTSRNHCNVCLHSIHVDINPGDRANLCRGLLTPIDIAISGKKGYIIKHKCKSCGIIVNNKVAHDDDFERILEICKEKQ